MTRADIILAAQIPMDVMWLDIEYSKQHMYMIWDEVTFPDPERMIQGLDDEGRKVSQRAQPHRGSHVAKPLSLARSSSSSSTRTSSAQTTTSCTRRPRS